MSRPATSRLKVNPPIGSLPVLQYCAPDQLQIDQEYQRSLDAGSSQTLIRRIAVHWDWGLCQPLFVARRADGGFYVVDGQHRLAAARLRGDIWQLPCVVSSFATMADEAASFVALNQQRRPLSALDLFKAALAAGDDEAKAIVRALEAAGLTLATTTNNQLMKAGAVGNIGGLLRCYRHHGEHVLATAAAAMARAFPDEILRYAGTLFPGLVAIVADQIKARVPINESAGKAAMVAGQATQGGWYKSILAAGAVDPNLNRRRAAEQVFRAAFERANQQSLAAASGGARCLPPPSTYLKPAETEWCKQCDQRVSGAKAERCQSPFCSLKVKAA